MTLETIRAAHARIAPYIVQTPLLRLPALDDALGCEVYVKAECMQRTGAFKLRGAMNKILALTEAERARGFVAASSGNHGRAVAYAAQRFGTHACIVMPEHRARPSSRRPSAHWARSSCCAMLPSALHVAARLCAERGATMIPPFNDELVMAGQGTVGLEILEQCPATGCARRPRQRRRAHRRRRHGGQGARTARARLRRGAGGAAALYGRACAPGIRCRWSSSARSRTRSWRKGRGMCVFRMWPETPTVLRMWRMPTFCAP